MDKNVDFKFIFDSDGLMGVAEKQVNGRLQFFIFLKFSMLPNKIIQILTPAKK